MTRWPTWMPSALLLCAGCGSYENIRVEDDDQVLFAARARYTQPIRERERASISLGGELGGHTVHGAYGSPSGQKDYGVDIGYAAFVAEFGVFDVRLVPKVGISIVDFDVDGQTRTVAQRGLAGMVGFEARYATCSWLDLVARGSAYRRSSFIGTLTEIGVELRASDAFAIEVAYGVADNDIGGTFGIGDVAEVESRGLLLGISLLF